MSAAVYGPYDQESLDLEYDMKRRCPHFAETFAHLESDNLRVVEDFDCRLDVPCGDSALQTLDIWPAKGGAPMLLFIHGGYWRAFDKAMFRYVVKQFVESGACVVLNNYDLCPEVTMDQIAEQNRQAFAWIWNHADDLGCDRSRFFVTGHSAGGHLTAILASTNWPARGMPEDSIRAAFPLSGLFDLEPLRLCYLNDDLRMSESDSHRNSPVHMIPDLAPPMVVAVGGGETDEFKRQSRLYTDACLDKGLTAQYLELDNHDHVFAALEYTNAQSPLTTSILTAFDA